MKSSINGFNSGGESREEGNDRYKLKTPKKIVNKLSDFPVHDVMMLPVRIGYYVSMSIIGLIGGIVILLGYNKAKDTFTAEDDILDKFEKVMGTKL